MLVLIIGSQYTSRVVNYDRKLFIRLTTGHRPLDPDDHQASRLNCLLLTSLWSNNRAFFSHFHNINWCCSCCCHDRETFNAASLSPSLLLNHTHTISLSLLLNHNTLSLSVFPLLTHVPLLPKSGRKVPKHVHAPFYLHFCFTHVSGCRRDSWASTAADVRPLKLPDYRLLDKVASWGIITWPLYWCTMLLTVCCIPKELYFWSIQMKNC